MLELNNPLEDLTAAQVAALLDAVAADDHPQFEVAHVYDRKGHDSYDRVLGGRNTSYGSDDDDFVVMVRVRVARWGPMWEHVSGVVSELKDAKAAAEEAALLARRVVLEAELADIDSKIGQR